MWWSQEGRELDDIPVMTDEVPLMTGEVFFTGEVQWWGFGLTWKQ